MRNSSPAFRRFANSAALVLLATGGSALGQSQAAQGFAVERLEISPAGAGWWTEDELRLQGDFTGAVAVSTGYAQQPLLVSSLGSDPLAVVSAQAFAELNAAVSYHQFRLSIALPSPIVVKGRSGSVAGWAFTAPAVDLGQFPDSIADPRVGLTARIVGDAEGPFRLGAQAELLIPSGDPNNYLTDGTYRAKFRLLFAGEVGWFTYAAHLGFHLRPLDETTSLGTPAGNEALFGVAAGVRLMASDHWRVVVGPEVFGETALRGFFGSPTTGVEALLGARLEGVGDGPRIRLKVGAGGGLDAHFGAPQWRGMIGAELVTGQPLAPR